jgi:hypothetical protein
MAGILANFNSFIECKIPSILITVASYAKVYSTLAGWVFVIKGNR